MYQFLDETMCHIYVVIVKSKKVFLIKQILVILNKYFQILVVRDL